jgi:CRP-like cAMP-binding protein
MRPVPLARSESVIRSTRSGVPMDRVTAEEAVLARGWLMDQKPAFQKALLAAAVLHRVGDGALLQLAGEPARGLAGIAAGYATVEAADARSSILLDLRRCGDWFGECCLGAGEPAPCTITARGDVVLLLIERSRVLRLVSEQPDALRALWTLTADRAETLLDIATTLAQPEARRRVASVLLRLSGGDAGALPLSQAEIAEMTRLSRGNLGKALKELRAAGLIITGYRQIDIVDVRGLMAAALEADPLDKA